MTDRGAGSPRRTPSPSHKNRVSSPVAPLAPLEYLQNQRRGSITDPSLHAAPISKQPQLFRQTDSASSSNEPRPASSYVFGDASLHNSENSSQIRKLMSRTEEAPSSERRHSIAEPLTHGTKRKMSSSDEIDPQLVGPGVPSMMDESDGPAPKRRGSAFDTQRIAQLSLNDRRHSIDSRSYWHNNPALSGAESPNAARPPPGIATFTWPTNSHPPDMNNNQADRQHFDAASLAMMPPMNFNPERRMSVPDPLTSSSASPSRVLRSRSRPPSRQMRGVAGSSTPEEEQAQPLGKKEGSSSTPYSRSPELRVSHKLAERKRRKEMKDLFDELRDHLPADRGMKASKWEILSKAIDFVQQLKQGHQDMAREIEMLRHELELVRQGGGIATTFPPGNHPHVVYSQGPPSQFATVTPQPPLSRPSSSQNVFPPATQNGNVSRAEAPPT